MSTTKENYPEITMLRSFLLTAKTGSFTEAAKLMKVSQPAISPKLPGRYGICQDTSKKLVRSLFIPEEPQQGLCPYASLPQDIFLT